MLSVNLFAAAPGDDDKKNSIEIQGKGLANSTWLFNKHISDAGNEQDYAAGWGFNYGAAFNMYFGNVGFGVEALLGNHKGAYAGAIDIKDASGTVTSTYNYTSNVNLKTTQIPVLFKLKNETGGYLEVGAQYNVISSGTFSYLDEATVITDTSYSVSKNYVKNFFSGVLGFGFKIPIAKSRVGVVGGIRLQYGFTDLKGVDAMGRELNNPFFYKTGAKTAYASGGFTLGVVYSIGGPKPGKDK